MKRIELNIPTEITHLAGHALGRYICCSQVEPHISKNDDAVIIEIPDHIEHVVIGFIQGLKAILLMGGDIEVQFKAKNKKLEEKIMQDYKF